MYVANESLLTHTDKKDTGRHLVVLAKNETGYHNLIKLVSRSWTEGFYSHPRTDKADLAAHSEGLIVCSACLGGEVPRLIQAGQTDEAEKAILWFKNTFGDDYYIELQRHKATVPRANHEVYPIQQHVNEELVKLARKHDIKNRGHQRCALRQRGRRRSPRPPYMCGHRQGPQRPQTHAVLQTGVDEIDRRDEHPLRRHTRSAGQHCGDP